MTPNDNPPAVAASQQPCARAFHVEGHGAVVPHEFVPAVTEACMACGYSEYLCFTTQKVIVIERKRCLDAFRSRLLGGKPGLSLTDEGVMEALEQMENGKDVA